MPPLLAARLSCLLALLMIAWMAWQWSTRGRKPHHAAWAIGFLFYAAGTFIEGFLEWNATTLPLYYWVAAYMTAAALGQGSAYIHLARRRAHVLAGLLGAFGACALVACFLAPMDPAVPLPERGEVSMAMFPSWLRSGTLFFNLYGLVLLAGGAVLSMLHYRSQKGGARRFWANLLILCGVLVIGGAGAATKTGAKEILLFAELAGLVLLALGVYVAG